MTFRLKKSLYLQAAFVIYGKTFDIIFTANSNSYFGKNLGKGGSAESWIVLGLPIWKTFRQSRSGSLPARCRTCRSWMKSGPGFPLPESSATARGGSGTRGRRWEAFSNGAQQRIRRSRHPEAGWPRTSTRTLRWRWADTSSGREAGSGKIRRLRWRIGNEFSFAAIESGKWELVIGYKLEPTFSPIAFKPDV